MNFPRYCTDIATPSCDGDSTEKREIPKPRCETDGGMEITIVKEVSEGLDKPRRTRLKERFGHIKRSEWVVGLKRQMAISYIGEWHLV